MHLELHTSWVHNTSLLNFIKFNFFSLFQLLISISRRRASLRVLKVSEYNNFTGLLILV